MITTITTELVQGALALIQTIRYTNGKTVRRLLNSNGIPVEIL